MRNSILWLASAVVVTLILTANGSAQPPGDRRGPPDPFGRRGGGPPGGLERVLDDLKLSEGNRETALAAVRAFQEDRRRLSELAGSDLLLKMKEILSPEEYKKLKEAADRARNDGGGPRRLATDDVVEHIMSFDKNKDGKVTKDELPERMQDLIVKGDTNKDGALDRDEIKKLAADLAREESTRASGPGDRFPPGPGGRGGRGGRGAPGGFPPGAVERAVDELKLTGKTKEAVAATVKAHQENVRKLTELVRADLVLTMTDVLSEADLKKFTAAVERAPAIGERPGPRGGLPPFPPFGRGGPGRP